METVESPENFSWGFFCNTKTKNLSEINQKGFSLFWNEIL